jgi:hypothetical protein
MPPSKKAKSKPKPKPKSAAAAQDFAGAFAGLRAILAKHAHKLKVTKDLPDNYYLDTEVVRKDGYPIFFGAAIIKKNYVSLHLMPIYVCPELKKTISPELQKRMQGKACFNFTAPDKTLFAELDALTANSIDKFHVQLAKMF